MKPHAYLFFNYAQILRPGMSNFSYEVIAPKHMRVIPLSQAGTRSGMDNKLAI